MNRRDLLKLIGISAAVPAVAAIPKEDPVPQEAAEETPVYKPEPLPAKWHLSGLCADLLRSDKSVYMAGLPVFMRWYEPINAFQFKVSVTDPVCGDGPMYVRLVGESKLSVEPREFSVNGCPAFITPGCTLEINWNAS